MNVNSNSAIRMSIILTYSYVIIFSIHSDKYNRYIIRYISRSVNLDISIAVWQLATVLSEFVFSILTFRFA